MPPGEPASLVADVQSQHHEEQENFGPARDGARDLNPADEGIWAAATHSSDKDAATAEEVLNAALLQYQAAVTRQQGLAALTAQGKAVFATAARQGAGAAASSVEATPPGARSAAVPTPCQQRGNEEGMLAQ